MPQLLEEWNFLNMLLWIRIVAALAGHLEFSGVCITGILIVIISVHLAHLFEDINVCAYADYSLSTQEYISA